MSDWTDLFLLSVLAVNPPGAIAGYHTAVRRLGRTEHFPLSLIAAGAAAVLVLLFTGIAEPARAWLDVEASSFRIAAGVLLLVGGIEACWRGHTLTPYPGPGWQSAIYPLALPLIAGPSLIGVLMHGATGPDTSAGDAIGAALPVAVGTAIAAPWIPSRLSGVLRAVARSTGAIAVVAGVGLIINGVQSV